MRVSVVRSHTIPSGTIGLEDRYETDPETGVRSVVEIILTFNDDDLPEETVEELSAVLTVEGQRWVEVQSTTYSRDDLPKPPHIQVRRVPGLPCRVILDDDLDDVIVLFHDKAIKEPGARAYEDFLIRRSATWIRKEGA
ncbi:hypothetical protein ACWF94_03495 [Streptomyces sp. NPDC055078]